MSEIDAADVGAYAQELFKFTTDAQATAVAKLVLPLPDPKHGREILFALSCESTDGRISMSAVAAAVKASLIRSGLTTEDISRRNQRKQEAVVYANWQKIDELIAQLSDQDIDDLKPQALLYLTNQKARDMVGKLSPRESRTMRWLLYRVLTDDRGAA